VDDALDRLVRVVADRVGASSGVVVSSAGSGTNWRAIGSSGSRGRSAPAIAGVIATA
jgi:hypothetical protein